MITFEIFIEALNVVEASGKKRNVPPGDQGTRIGPLQIAEIYWKDSLEWMKKNEYLYVPNNLWTWDKCANWEFAKTIAYMYFRRYAPKALRDGDWEKLARIHNGGPNGYKKKSTLEYWEKVKKALDELTSKGE